MIASFMYRRNTKWHCFQVIFWSLQSYKSILLFIKGKILKIHLTMCYDCIILTNQFWVDFPQNISFRPFITLEKYNLLRKQKFSYHCYEWSSSILFLVLLKLYFCEETPSSHKLFQIKTFSWYWFTVTEPGSKCFRGKELYHAAYRSILQYFGKECGSFFPCTRCLPEAKVKSFEIIALTKILKTA